MTPIPKRLGTNVGSILLIIAALIWHAPQMRAETLSWGTYTAGENGISCDGVAVDRGGNVYVTGTTAKPREYGGDWDTDVYVEKYDSTGKLLWTTSLGGTDEDRYGSFHKDSSFGIAVNSEGCVCVTGLTNSHNWIRGGWDTTPNGRMDAFVVKLSDSGTHLWSSYLGGVMDDEGYGVTMDDIGNVYVTGSTESPGWVSPEWDGVLDGASDGFLLSLTSDGAFRWSRYLGGSENDSGKSVAADSNGNIYVAGNTNSHSWISAGWDTSFSGGSYTGDGYVMKLSTKGEHLWSSYLGGKYSESCNAIAIDKKGNAYATGLTTSKDWISGGWGNAYYFTNYYSDAYLVKLNASGDHVWSGYLGGQSGDEGSSLVVDFNGNVYAIGTSWYDGWSWVSGGWDLDHSGIRDGYIIKLTESGEHLWSSFFGGKEEDQARSVAADCKGNIYVVGSTFSSDWLTRGNDTSINGPNDGFLIKINDNPFGSLRITLSPPAAIAAGAQWRRQGTTVWYNSGDTETGVLTGEWIIEFKELPSWIEPELTATITDGGLTDLTATYRTAPALFWGTYLGGNESDYGNGIAVDASGNIYAIGQTYSHGWISGGSDVTQNGGSDVYVVKLSSAGALLWSTYLGGSNYDTGYDIAADGDGNVYATGATDSSGWISGGWDSSQNGATDGFVVKLDSTGKHLWSSYIGGANGDYSVSVVIDKSGNAYLTGYTFSTGWVSGGWDTTYGGSWDAFIVKMSAAGEQLWSSYLGGKNDDWGWDIAADDFGNAYATGYTSSSGLASGGWDTSFGGDWDAYVAKISPAGEQLWSSYLGGTSTDFGYGIAVDGDGNVYATGETSSKDWVGGGWDTSQNGRDDAYVVKLSSGGDHQWSSYLGGTGDDQGHGIVANGGAVFATGATASSDWIRDGWDETHNAGSDGYLVKISSTGTHPWSSYLGGKGGDLGRDITADANGNVYVSGSTHSSGWLSGGWDISYNGESDGFVIKIGTIFNCVIYTAGQHGSISGVDIQMVAPGGCGTEVDAVPDSGYVFQRWGDGVMTAKRTDASVTSDKTVTAYFALEGTEVEEDVWESYR